MTYLTKIDISSWLLNQIRWGFDQIANCMFVPCQCKRGFISSSLHFFFIFFSFCFFHICYNIHIFVLVIVCFEFVNKQFFLNKWQWGKNGDNLLRVHNPEAYLDWFTIFKVIDAESLIEFLGDKQYMYMYVDSLQHLCWIRAFHSFQQFHLLQDKHKVNGS